MSEEHLLLIINRWKNEAYQLSRQLQFIKNAYQLKLNEIPYETNSIKQFYHSLSIKNDNILKELLTNMDQSIISDQLSVLSHFFLDALKSLLLSNIIEEKQRSTLKSSPIIENIETNIKQIRDLINQMNKDCLNQLIPNRNSMSFEK